ncbi:MAG: nuclease [Phenylobacterium zucineum]|nr:MAG: nuclease [Phenylobacterium zucineum]
MREVTVEAALTAAAKKAGGLALKWVSPGYTGVPDRIVFFPDGRIVFVELKAPGKSLRPRQVEVHKELKRLGVDVRAIDTVEDARALFA